MSKRLFVGNLSYQTQVNELETAFAAYGVTDVHLPTDRMSGQPRGFAFVTVDDGKALEAISAMNGADLDGRALTVNEAKPREERGSGGGGGRDYSGGGGGGGRDYSGGGGGGGNRW